MSQTNNGRNELSIEEKLQRTDDSLDEYERALGIPLVGEDDVTQEARRIIGLSPSSLRCMSAIECGEAAFVLGQYTHRLQQAINREQARMTWAEEAIKKIIAKKLNQYRGVSFEERKMQAIQDDEAASKIDSIRVRSKLRIDRINYLSAKTENLIKSLMSIRSAKGGRNE